MRPHQGAVQTFKAALHFGELRGILVALGIPYALIQPQTWSEEFAHGVEEKDKLKRYRAIKVARKKIATDLFPGIDLRESDRCKTPHEGMVDALLLAEFGYRLRRKGKA